MTKRQKLERRQREIKKRLNAINALEGDALTDEIRAESRTLVAELNTVDDDLDVAIAVDEADETRAAAEFGDGDAETRARRALESRADIADVFTAAVQHRATAGATAELQQLLRLPPNAVPTALFAGGGGRPVETRAVTPAPANVAGAQQPIVAGVFPQSVAAFLGIDMPTVPAGEAIFPVLATNAAVGAPAENAEQDETTGSFSAAMLAPGRLQASFFFSREDIARFPGMQESLRTNLGDALADALDDQIISGANGLLTGANLAANAAAARTTFATYRSGLAFGRIDGTYAATAADLRIVAGAATYADMAGQYRANSADDSALDSLMRVTGGVRVSAHVPAVNANKQNAVVRRGMRRDMVAPIWEGVTLIPDEVTKAKTGQIVITAVMLHSVKILRAGGFAKIETQHA